MLYQLLALFVIGHFGHYYEFFQEFFPMIGSFLLNITKLLLDVMEIGSYGVPLVGVGFRDSQFSAKLGKYGIIVVACFEMTGLKVPVLVLEVCAMEFWRPWCVLELLTLFVCPYEYVGEFLIDDFQDLVVVLSEGFFALKGIEPALNVHVIPSFGYNFTEPVDQRKCI